MNKINVFIPAAGLGERLRPITNHIPKPLIPVLGKPVMQRVIDNVSALPFHRIGINLHYRKEAIEEWIQSGPLNEKIVLFPEEKILGTGGALKNAEAFLQQCTFLVHNSDILTDINLNGLLDHHRASGNLVTLAVHDYPKFNSVVVDERGFFKGVEVPPHPPLGKGERRTKVAFTGIAVYEPGFLGYLPEGWSSVVDAWIKASSDGRKIGTYDVSGNGSENPPYWSDIGTPDAYTAAVFEQLRREGETVYIHPSAGRCEDMDVQGHVVIEEGSLPVRSISLKNCMVLPGGRIPVTPPFSRREGQGTAFESCILGPDYQIALNVSEILKIDEKKRQLIGTGGSDRKYYRIRNDHTSVVLMQCSVDDPDFERQIEYTRFFRKHDVPVPELIKADIVKKNALLEDAGDISLYSWLKFPRSRADIEDMYRQVLNIIVLIHTEVTGDIPACPLLGSRIFDYEHFRWETDYFINRYVEGMRNYRVRNLPMLNEELHQLAAKADSFPKGVIHRDFQSQNIMVIKGRELRLIDYQGARIGPQAYDVASLLWDPYYRLEDEIRERLLDYYMDMVKAGSSEKVDEDDFRRSLVLCRLQRHMQALGAYSFLSRVKGKNYFQKFMPEGLRLLKSDAIHAKEDYPELYELIQGL